MDAVVSDPPYGLEFMGKDWDRPWAVGASNGVGYEGRDDLRLPSHRDTRNANCRTCGGRQRGSKRCSCERPDWDRHPREDMVAFQEWATDWAVELLRVLKPGGHLLAFGGTRTYHRLACAIEDAGFEIRDSIHWVYGSGFPKSLDVSKAIDKAAGAEREVVGSKRVTRVLDAETLRRDNYTVGVSAAGGSVPVTAPATEDAARWQGWGTALKPAHEPIVVARKPLAGTVAQTVLAHGTGALNIDGCRVGTEQTVTQAKRGQHGTGSAEKMRELGFRPYRTDNRDYPETVNPPGRWPPNFILTHSEGMRGGRDAGGDRDHALAG